MATESEFLQQLKDALSHLYDFPYLEGHALAQRCWPEPEQRGPNRAQRLHRLLLEGIEALNPADTPAKGASQAEYYLLLVYRYVEERPLAEIMQELGYSRRQFFRQQQKAIEMLAGLLLEKVPPSKLMPAKPEDMLDDELERFRSRYHAIDPRAVAQGVLELMGPVAQQQGVNLSWDLPEALPVIYGSRTLLRQVFLTALSQLITQPGSQHIHLRLSHERRTVTAELTAEFDLSGVETTARAQKLGLEPIRHLLEPLHGHWQIFELKEHRCRCRFDFPAGAEKVVLVVDDNEAVTQVFNRYLAEYNYQVVGATTGEEALAMAREMHPSVITLDVMIPGQDGWEILHALKADPAMRLIPVVICSVLEDPELARLLGAAAYLQKPVVQADLLTTLDRLIHGA